MNFDGLSEINSFSSEEDKAVNSQLDGESLVKDNASLKQELQVQVADAAPSWLTSKSFFKNKSGLGKDSLVSIEGVDDIKKSDSNEVANYI